MGLSLVTGEMQRLSSILTKPHALNGKIEIPEVLDAKEPPHTSEGDNKRYITSNYEYEKRYYTQRKDRVAH
jgi:hypothetical protein